jgi:hypothetical protein
MLRMTFGLGLALLMGCTHFERSPESGYSPQSMSKMQTYRTKPTIKDPEWGSLQSKTRIKQLENTLRTKKELDQYSKVLPLFKDDQERAEFLELSGFETRSRWLNKKDVPGRAQAQLENMRELIEAQDISVGMAQTAVKKSWGTPENIEVSGNPQFRNERWRYSKYVSTPEGYKLERKVVYFEAGKVVGWEIE